MDVIELQEFYADPLGLVARRMIAHRIRARVNNLKGRTVVGLGYATPYLDGWRDEVETVLGFMPARQGVARWPRNCPNVAALVDDGELPLPDGCIDIVLIVHGLEFTENLSESLREVWRVIKPGGKVVIVVPNRRGLWARRDSTPFGHGRPFSRGQISRLLREAMFDPGSWAYALFVPPFNRAFLRRSAAWWERIGLRLWQGFAGVIIVEATKQVYATVDDKRGRRVPARLKPALSPVPGGVTTSSPKAVARDGQPVS